MRLAIHLEPFERLTESRSIISSGAAIAEVCGVDGVVVKIISADGIKDVASVRSVINTHLTLELPPDKMLVRKAMEIKPDQVTFVGKNGDVLKLEDIINNLTELIETLHAVGIETSVLIDPDIQQVKLAQRAKLDYLTLSLNAYTSASSTSDAVIALEAVESTAMSARKTGMRVLAKGDISLRNIRPFLGVDLLEEIILGGSFYQRSLFVGMNAAISELRETIVRR